jgi:hypothetical protein
MYKEITKCRICGNTELVSVLHLGEQYLTGVFPKEKSERITCGPIELVKCMGSEEKSCGLLQMRQSYDLGEMYGVNYGYRSGLNASMVAHLQEIVKKLLGIVPLDNENIVLDIGSNDSTLLRAYPLIPGLKLVGMDPTGIKFKEYYPSHIRLVPDFFSQKAFKDNFGDKKARIVTSIAMFYDLENPLDFMKQVADVLDEKGVWAFEQSYMPTMLSENAYDTICHEHLEFYALRQIKWMADLAGLKIIDIELNKINGGSFLIVVAHRQSSLKEATAKISAILEQEKKIGLNTLVPFQTFKEGVFHHRDLLCQRLKEIRSKGEKVFGYGASTKGNVILQWCGLTAKEIPYIAEVNKDNFGSLTPGTNIPIISEAEARRMNPEYFLVLPWHFKENIIEREQDYLRSGGKFLFPLPKLEIVSQ